MRNGVFEDQVKARMAEFDIPDTVLNRERALTEIFRAKADVLLDIGERYPLVDREKSLLTRTGHRSEAEAQEEPEEAALPDGEIEPGAPSDPTLSNRAASEVAPVGLSAVGEDVPPATVAEATEDNAASPEVRAQLSGPELSAATGTIADAPGSESAGPDESIAD